MENILIQKLKWNSTRRSLLELDICFDKFLQNGGLEKLDSTELLAYKALLELDDSDLLILLMGGNEVEDETTQKVINKIRNSAKIL